MSDSILNIDKPQGWTSHDVVARVRRLTGVKRVGHAGTLDPLATGVLLVCVGTATRIVSHLQSGRKVYRATIRLGERTDTYDADGAVLEKRPVPDLSRADIESVLQTFTGTIWQTPPMYSALKVQGQTLHKLARAGIEVERAPRAVQIDALGIGDQPSAWQSPDLTLDITCSPGVYIRSLAHDIGEKLGCGAHITALRRLASGVWRVEDAVTLDKLLSAGPEWTQYQHGLNEALALFPALILSADEARRFTHGQVIPLPPGVYDSNLARILDSDEHLLGLAIIDSDRGLLRPDKVFHDPPT